MSSGQRSLDLAESTFWLLDRASSMNFAVMARLSGDLDEDLLRQGLQQLQTKHPLLQCSVQHDAEKGELAFLHQGLQQSIPLVVDQVRPESRSDAAGASGSAARGSENGAATTVGHESLQVVARSMMEPFASGSYPLMRALLLRSPERCRLVLIFHHSIADGRSGIRLLQELIAFLAHSAPRDRRAGEGSAQTGEASSFSSHRSVFDDPHSSDHGHGADSSPVDQTSAPELPDGMHSLLPAELLKAPVMEENPAVPVSFFGKKSSEPSPWLAEIRFSTDDTEALRNRSKEWGCTLHGMLGGILLSALAQCDAPSGGAPANNAGNGAASHRLALASPADMRGKLASGKDDLALYISLITTTVDVSGSSQELPELSASISANVRRQIEERPLDFYHLLPDPKRYLSKADPGKAYGALISRLPQATALSNAGVVSDFSSAKDGSWVVEDVSFSVHPSLSQMVFVAATTYGGSLTLTVNLDASRWSEGLPLRYVQKVEGMCKAVAETKD